MPIPVFLSTKSGFLCAFGFRGPCFRAFRAQNRGFCALLAFGAPDFWLFEHKIEVFVRFCPPKPPFSGISSTKSRFLCAFGLRDPRFLAFRAQNRHFCALWMWDGAQVLAVTIAVAVALTVAKVLALTTILAEDLAVDMVEDLAVDMAVDLAVDMAEGLALDMAAGLSLVLA